MTAPFVSTPPSLSRGVQPYGVASLIGKWYPATAQVGTSNNATTSLAVGTATMGTPVVAQKAITIDTVGCYVKTGGSAGSVVRIAVYRPQNALDPFALTINSAYADLLVDAGTAAATVNDTRATITLGTPLVIPAGSAFAIAVAVQSGGTVVLLGEGLSNQWPSPWGSDVIIGGANAAVKRTDVTGAFPSTFTPTALHTAGIGGSGWYKRSA